MATYIVELSRVEYQSTTVEVEAENRSQAGLLAMQQATDWKVVDADQSVENVVGVLEKDED